MIVVIGLSVVCVGLGYIINKLEKIEGLQKTDFKKYVADSNIKRLEAEKNAKYWQVRFENLKLQTSVWILEKEEEVERLGELLNGKNIK